MKIAIPYENGMVFGHFGHTEAFKLYETSDGKITKMEILSTDGQGHGALAGFLKGNGVDLLICGGIGGGAKTALANAGIRVLAGVSGAADAAAEAVRQYMRDFRAAGYDERTITWSDGVTCSGHGQGEAEERHSCGGGHGCSCKNG